MISSVFLAVAFVLLAALAKTLFDSVATPLFNRLIAPYDRWNARRHVKRVAARAARGHDRYFEEQRAIEAYPVLPNAVALAPFRVRFFRNLVFFGCVAGLFSLLSYILSSTPE